LTFDILCPECADKEKLKTLGWDDDSYYTETDPMEFISDLYSIMEDGDGLSVEDLAADIVDMLKRYLEARKERE